VEFGAGQTGTLTFEVGSGKEGDPARTIDLTFDASDPDGTLDDLIIALNQSLDTAGHGDLLRAVSWNDHLSFTLVDGVARTLEVSGADAAKLGFEDGQQAYVLMPKATVAAEFANWAVGVEVLGIDLGATPSLDVTVEEFSLFDLRLPDFAVTDYVDVQGLDDLGELPSFDDLTFSDVVAGLREVLDFITELEGLDFLDTEIPILEVRLGDLLEFGSDFLEFIEDFENNFAGTLQQVEGYIEDLLGLEDSMVELSLERTGDELALRLDLVFEALAQENLAVKLDLFELLENVTGLDLGFLSSFEDLIDIGGSAALDLEARAALNLSLGIELSTEPSVFLFDDGTSVEITAKALGTDIEFDAVLGPIGVYVRDGVAGINRYGNDPDPDRRDEAAGLIVSFNDADGDNRITFDEIFGSGGGLTDIVDFDFAATAFAYLPVDVPPVGGPDSNIGTIEFTLEFPSLEEFTNPTLTLNKDDFPDFSQILSDFDISENLLAMVGGWEGVFDLVIDAMQGEVFGFTVPLIGDALGDAADFIVDLKETVVDTLEKVGTQGINFVQQGIYDAVGPEGLGWLKDAQLEGEVGFGLIDINDVVVERTPDSGIPDEVKFNFSLGQDLVALDFPFAFDLGFPGLGLDVDADLELLLGFDFDIGFGVSMDKGVFIDTSDPDELEVYLQLLLPGFAATGSLGFLQIDVYEDRDRLPEDEPTRLEGYFSVDLKDPDGDPNDGDGDSLTLGEIFGGLSFDETIDFDYGIAADVDLDIVTSLAGSSMLPRLRTDFALDWGLGSDEIETRIAFENIELNLGDFFGGFAGEVLGEVKEVLDPIQPIVDALTDPIPVISDLAGDISLADIARIFGRADIAAFLDAVKLVNDFIYSLPEDLGSETWIYLGGFDVNIGAAEAENSDGGGMDGSGVSNLIETYDAVSPEEIGDQFDSKAEGSSKFTKSAGFQGKGKLEFPIISQPLTIFNLLMGQDIDLFLFDAPPFVLEFSYEQSFPIPPFPIVAAEIGGRIAATADFAFGFDTSGIRQFLDSDDFLDIFNGFFISDRLNPDGTGADVPEFIVEGQLTAGGKVDLLIAEAGVRGGIFPTVFFNLHDLNNDGRIRANELLENLQLRYNPIDIFDVSGDLSAGLEAFFSINLGIFSISKNFELASITIVDFEIPRPEDGVVLAIKDGSNLILNMDDSSENFVLKQGTLANSVIVEAKGYTREFENITGGIFGDARGGDDIITVSDGLTMPVVLFGGAGNDQLYAGGGPATFYGGAGDDLLVGAGSNDSLFGEAGRDTLKGGLGDDLLDGGDGSDRLEGESGDDVLRGQAGEDHLYGGDGDDWLEGGDDSDVLLGERGSDIIFGDAGNDLIEGGLGNDELHGGADQDAIYGGKGRDEIYGDGGDDLIDGGTENDDIFGGAGNDNIQGGFGVDLVRGGDDDDIIRGGEESDLLYGDGGDDIIYAADSKRRHSHHRGRGRGRHHLRRQRHRYHLRR
jgi:Ca2+-binding RTX toxin-like protein